MTKISLIARNSWLDRALWILQFKVIYMATNTTLLTRRSFSTWLAASGFVLTTSRRAPAQDLVESEQFLPFGEARRLNDLVADDSKAEERWTAAANESWQWYERESLLHGQWKLTGITTPVHRVTGKCFEAVPGYLDESPVPIECRRVDHGRQEGHPAVVRSEPPLWDLNRTATCRWSA